MEEKILEVCKVTPPPDSPTDDICLPLTFFDLFNSIFPPVEHLIFYETRSLDLPHSVLLSKLKHSLSLTLRHFLPAAGYLVWPCSSPNPFIRYKNGDGVLLTVAQSNADFFHLWGDKIRKCKIFLPLISQIVKSGDQVPLIAFKVTLFPNQGICIGVTTNHSLFDGTSAMLFLNSWASFTKFGSNGNLGEELTPVFDRKLVRERHPELESLFLEILKEKEVTPGEIWTVQGPMLPAGMVRGTFVLSDSDVSQLKGLVSARLEGNNQVPRASTFAVAFAYIVLCLLKVKPPKNGRVNLFFHFDCRGRLAPPLPRNYFGNCVGACDKYFNTEDLMGWDGMAFLVNFISETTKDFDDGGALKEAHKWIPNIFKSDADTDSLIVIVFGSVKFGLQSIDFGWGRPKKADISSIDGAGGLHFAGRNETEGGIEVELSLNEFEMEKFAYLFDKGIRDIKKPIRASL